MTKVLLVSLRVAFLSSVVMSLATGCGSSVFSSKKQAAKKEDAVASEKLQDCLALGNPGTNVQTPPGQEPVPPNYGPQQSSYDHGHDNGYDNGYDHGGQSVVVVVPGQQQTYQPTQQPYQGSTSGSGSYDVVVKPCTAPGYTGPTQTPSQSPNQGPSDYYQPIATKGGEPGPYPTQLPVVPTECGKNGNYCDDGKGGGQWPTEAAYGQSYDRGDVEGCLGAFRNSGYDTAGMWNIVVREEKNVSVLTEDTFTDQGNDHALVIVKGVNVLAGVNYQLLNPNALYCIKTVSVLESTRVTSCRQSNVMYGKDISVLSHTNNEIVNCGY